MRFIDIIRLALGNLKRNKLRTSLTIAGMVIGIGAIVFLVSLGFGLQRLTVQKIASVSALTILEVTPGKAKATHLNETTIAKLKKIPQVSKVSPILNLPSKVTFKETNTSAEGVVYGVKPSLFDLEGVKLSLGKPLSKKNTKEAVLSQAILKPLKVNKPEEIIDKEISLTMVMLISPENNEKGKAITKTETFKVSGITRDDETSYVYIPLSNLKTMAGKNGLSYSSVKIKVAERGALQKVHDQIEEMGFTTSSIEDTIKQVDKIFFVFQLIMGFFGMIALFVASIGIFNTMTISFLERIHEIGIMKALGISNRDVRRTFLGETAAIGLLGGIFGVFVGWLAGKIINAVINFLATSVGGETVQLFYLPPSFIFTIIIFALIVSIATGFWPARRAGKLNPLEALRERRAR